AEYFPPAGAGASTRSLSLFASPPQQPPWQVPSPAGVIIERPRAPGRKPARSATTRATGAGERAPVSRVHLPPIGAVASGPMIARMPTSSVQGVGPLAVHPLLLLDVTPLLVVAVLEVAQAAGAVTIRSPAFGVVWERFPRTQCLGAVVIVAAHVRMPAVSRVV